MATAYVCDRCEKLYRRRTDQELLIPYKEIPRLGPAHLKVVVGSSKDLCPECMVWCLEQAMELMKSQIV